MSTTQETAAESPTGPRKRSAADILAVVSNSLAENAEAEGIRKATAELVEQMREAAREANVIDGEPIAPLLDVLQRALAWMGELSARNAQATAEQADQIKRTVADVRRVAQAEIDRERAAVSADKAGIIREVSDAIAASTRETQHQTARTYNRNSWLASVAGVVAIIAAIGGSCYLLGRQQGATAAYTTDENLRAVLRVNPTSAPAWLNLMNSNDPAQTFAACHGEAVRVYNGRRACEVPVWLDPPDRFRKPPT